MLTGTADSCGLPKLDLQGQTDSNSSTRNVVTCCVVDSTESGHDNINTELHKRCLPERVSFCSCCIRTTLPQYHLTATVQYSVVQIGC